MNESKNGFLINTLLTFLRTISREGLKLLSTGNIVVGFLNTVIHEKYTRLIIALNIVTEPFKDSFMFYF